MVGLKNDLALFSCPARSSGDTGIKLSETLCGAEISGKQRPVDIQQETRVTSGKWCPLASIWVPIRIRAPPRWTAARCSSSAPLRLVVSRSIREIGTSGNSGAGPAPAARCRSLPAPDAWSRRKDTGAGSGAGCRNGGSADGAAPVQRIVTVAARVPLSSRNRGTAALAQSRGG